jgi:hypothetical protein
MNAQDCNTQNSQAKKAKWRSLPVPLGVRLLALGVRLLASGVGLLALGVLGVEPLGVDWELGVEELWN